MSATVPSASAMATRCSSPPERCITSWSMSASMLSGFITSETNCGWTYMSRIFLCSSARTDPSNFGEIFCGLYDTLSSGTRVPSSASSIPASIRMKVVLPVPFWPRSTRISESENLPGLISSLNAPIVLVIAGYSYRSCLSASPLRSSTSATRKVSASSRKRMFSVGMKPARKMLIPSRTEKGIVTTPYAPGIP
mmetsp:Transcript_4730/g.14616  ORF Transcript_4730/g.14616 Transcript_4730/m.14616 type:complete len:194 (-) Transcript_4730:945-1526(-)